MTPTTSASSPRLGIAGRPRAIGQRGRWRSVGRRRFRDVRPATLEAQLGYYSFAQIVRSATAHGRRAHSAAIADTAAQRVLGAPVVFARCRPPGHHAMKDQFGGIAISTTPPSRPAAPFRRTWGSRAPRRRLPPWNGTQDIFYERDDVRFCSIHGDPAEEFPYFLGHADEQGAGRGDGHNRNLPLLAARRPRRGSARSTGRSAG